MPQPSVSVIITSHNHELYIEQCVESVLKQTYAPLSVTVIDDGSSDQSVEIIKEFIRNNSQKIHFVQQENRGVCATRNRALDEFVDGDFVLFVDSDNYLEPNYISEMVQLAQQEEADIVYANLKNADTGEWVLDAPEFSLEVMVERNIIDNCALIRVAKIGNSRFDLELNRKKLEDYDFFLQLILTQQAIAKKCSTTWLNYRVLADSLSRKEEHASERYYYELYIYVLTKYQETHPILITAAFSRTIIHLEGRLAELITHLKKVDRHVHNLEKVSADQQATLLDLSRVISTLEEEKNNLESQLSNKMKLLEHAEAKKAKYQAISLRLQAENEALVQSTSYRIGNSIIRPVSYLRKAVKNPKNVYRVARHYSGRVYRKLKKVTPIKTYFLRAKRSWERKQNTTPNPRRVLVYVIYEGQEHLQEYKVLFLKALAKSCEKVVIVVNGSLNQADSERLEHYGEVVFRSNEGYDTAAFRHGIHHLGKDVLKNYQELLLVNDTNVGPFDDLEKILVQMRNRGIDFWGISYGEEQPDFTGVNPYGYIPIHLQSYFLVIEQSILKYDGFYEYWEQLTDTHSREKAIGKHETVFTKHFELQGFKHAALTDYNEDSPMYIHPLTMVKKGIPFVKYTAFGNYNSDKFAWQGLVRETEVPELLNYIKEETNYPMEVIDSIMEDVKRPKPNSHILVIDGVENAIPQLTTYRVKNKVEQLRSLGYTVWEVTASGFQMGHAEHASHIIIYRAPYAEKWSSLCSLADKYQKPVLFDIDDLVIDTYYTDQLAYTQKLDTADKREYDNGVESYGKLMQLCDAVVTSTDDMQHELARYGQPVYLNRNLANAELVRISQEAVEESQSTDAIVRIGYFSGSITHNENIEMILPALAEILKNYSHVELHIVGHLTIPPILAAYQDRLKQHDYVPWEKLPALIRQVDINLAPLVDSLFNRAKSEIKWIEASLVEVPTLASNIGSFARMIEDGKTGLLANENEWYAKLEQLVKDADFRQALAKNAKEVVLANCTTVNHRDQLIEFLEGDKHEAN